MLRRLIRVAVVAGLVAATAAVALYLLRLELAARWIVRELAARGVPGASLRVTRLEARGVTLEEIALGPELGIRELALDLDLGARERPVRRVRVAGARLMLEPGAPLPARVEALLGIAVLAAARGEGSASTSQSADLPALQIADARLLLGPGGERGTIDLALELAEPDGAGSSPGEIHMEARDLAWRDMGLGSATLDLPFRLAWSADRISVAWSEAARAELARASGLPISLAGALELRSRSGRIDVHLGEAMQIEIRGELTALEEQVSAALRAELEPAERSAQVRVVLAPVEFRPGGLQPAALDPRFAALRDVQGRVSAVVELRGSAGEVRSSSDLALDSLEFRTSGATIEGLAGKVRLASLSPLSSPPEQILDARTLEIAGIRFREPHLRFRIDPGGMHVEEARLRLGSGALRVADAFLGLTDAAREWTVQAEDLELEELLGLAGMDGVSGSGRISGSIPVRVAGGAIEIRGARLESSGPGRLRVRSERVRSALGSAGETVEQLVSALEDFHYETLRVELEKPARGESVARLHLLGRNPAVLEGHPFALNVNLETDLEPLLRAIGQGLQLSGELTRTGSRAR